MVYSIGCNTSTKELKDLYFSKFTYDNRLPELFDMIPEQELRKWIFGQLIND